MQQTISKFNIYEHLAFILVGLLQISLGYFLYLISTSKEVLSILSIFDLKHSLALILSSYFVGHFVQAMSNIFNKTEIKKKNQSEKYKYIQNKVLGFFGIPQEENKNTFQYCYFYVLSKSDILGKELLLFNSLYGLYRGFYYSFLISLVCGLFCLFVNTVVFFYCQHTFNIATLIYCIFCLLLSLIFRLRASRFFNYLGSKTYVAFDVLLKINSDSIGSKLDKREEQ